MEAAPEGLVEVRTPPAGAGRRGRRDALDWEAIVTHLRLNEWRSYETPLVPFNAVARLRERFRDIRFQTFQRRLVELEDGEKGTRKQLMCSLYVTCTGDERAGEDDDGSG